MYGVDLQISISSKELHSYKFQATQTVNQSTAGTAAALSVTVCLKLRSSLTVKAF